MRQGFLTLHLMCGSEGPAAREVPVLVVLSVAFFAAMGWKLSRGEGQWSVAE